MGQLLVGGRGGARLKYNLFVQPDEPDVKDGLWIKTSNQKGFNDVVMRASFNQVGTFDSKYLNNDGGYASLNLINIGGYLYAFGGSRWTSQNATKARNIYKYSLTQDTWELEQAGVSPLFPTGVKVDNSIYLMGGAKGSSPAPYVGLDTAIVYNPYTKTISQLPQMPVCVYCASGCSIDKTIYVGIGYGQEGYNGTSGWISGQYSLHPFSYNTSTQTYAILTSPVTSGMLHLVSVSDELYAFIGFVVSPTSTKDFVYYKYSFDTQTWNQITAEFINDTLYTHAISEATGIGVVENNLYFSGATGYADSGDKETFTLNVKTNGIATIAVPDDVTGGRAVGMCNVNGILYIRFNDNANLKSFCMLPVEPVNLLDGTLAIRTGGTYKIRLLDDSKLLSQLKKFSSDLITEKMKAEKYWSFSDAWLYTTDFQPYPTYIGDGTQWTKIKN